MHVWQCESMCVCMCMHTAATVYMCVLVYVDVYRHLCHSELVRAHACGSMCNVYVCICACTCACVGMSMYVTVCMSMHVCHRVHVRGQKTICRLLFLPPSLPPHRFWDQTWVVRVGSKWLSYLLSHLTGLLLLALFWYF